MQDVGKKIIIILLVANGWLLVQYAPLIPKALQLADKSVMLMNDVHDLRQKADRLEKVGADIQKTIAAIEKRFSFNDARGATGGMEAIPVGEADIHAWATGYVVQQKNRMQAEASSGRRPSKPDRDAVHKAVKDKFVASGRSLSPFTWLRIAFWVTWILLQL